MSRTFKALGLGGAFMLATALTPVSQVAAAEFELAGPLDAYTLDPHSISNTLVFALLHNVYDSLVKRSKDLGIEAGLATEWTQVEPLIWEFKLREGVTFSNGNAFTADDVVFSFHRAKSGGVKSHLASVDRIEKVDDYTVRLHTVRTAPVLPNEIVNWMIIDEDWAKENNAVQAGQADNSSENFAARNTMGTGAYVITGRDPGVKTVLERSPTWWGTPEGNVDKVTFHVIANPSTRVAALLTGEVDMIDSVPPQDAGRISQAPGFKVEAVADLRTVYIQPDVLRDKLTHDGAPDGNPLKDKRVREAMRLAIDTDAIKKRIMRGYSTPVGLPIANQVTGSTPELNAPTSPDLERAKALMAEAGYADGFDITFDCTNDRFINDEAICIAISSFLAQIKINVTPRAQTTSRWAEQVNPPGYNTSLAMLSYSPYTYDGYQFLTAIAMSRNPDTGEGSFNIGGYSNPAVDDLIRKIGAESDTAKREGYFHEAFTLIKADEAFLPIHQLQILWGLSDKAEVVQLPDLALPFNWFSIKE